MLLGDLDDLAELRLHLFVGAFDFDDEQCACIERISCMRERFANLDCELVHEFHRHWNDTVADDVGDASAGLFARREAEQNRARAFGRTQYAHRRLGDDAELAFRADDQPE